jgi:ribosome-binding protein aMBF1 (putative translation factor)
MKTERTPAPYPELHIAGGDYVVVPRAEYMRLVASAVTASDGVSVSEAKAMALREMGRRVRLARQHVGLTQADLAKKLGCTQAMVSRAESGTVSVSSRFLDRVHRACKLAADWLPPLDAE